MQAFTKGITKQEFLTEIYKHRDMDAFIKGSYSESENGVFQGFAIGLLIGHHIATKTTTNINIIKETQ